MRRREFMKTAGLLSGSALIGGMPLSVFAKDKVSFKFDSYVTDTAGPSIIDNWFLTELEKRTNGQVNVRRFWASSLSKVGEHLSAVADGTSEMALISPGYYQAQLPVTRGLEWYFRMNFSDSLQQLAQAVYDEFPPLKEEWEKRHRSKVLYWTTWNYAPFISRTPIHSLADIKGKRVRAYGVANDVIQRLGGTPVPMAAPEVYTALERGVLDAVYGFDFMTAVAYKLHEIAPHFTDIGDGPHAPAAVIMNKAFYDKLPHAVTKVMDDLTAELYAGKYAELINRTMTDYVKRALKEGVQFNILSDADKQQAKTIVQPAQTELWINEVAKPAGIDGKKMQALVARAIAKYDPHGKVLRPAVIAKQL